MVAGHQLPDQSKLPVLFSDTECLRKITANQKTRPDRMDFCRWPAGRAENQLIPITDLWISVDSGRCHLESHAWVVRKMAAVQRQVLRSFSEKSSSGLVVSDVNIMWRLCPLRTIVNVGSLLRPPSSDVHISLSFFLPWLRLWAELHFTFHWAVGTFISFM